MVGAAQSVRRTPIKGVDQDMLNRHLDALDRRELLERGMPPLRKHPMELDMLSAICSSPAYTQLAAAVRAKKPPPDLDDTDFNSVMAAVATALAFATANRHCNIGTVVQSRFNHNTNATRADFVIEGASFKYRHKPTKPDKTGSAWRGWSPSCPAIAHKACPVLALQIRDKLVPPGPPNQPLILSRTGACLRPMRTARIKELASDLALPMCPPGVTSVSTRQGHATSALQAGNSSEMISQFGKWTDPRSWRTYARVSNKAAKSYFYSIYSE